MAVRHINLEQYNNEILNSDKLVLIDFFATWCGPCKMLAPILEQVAEAHDDVEVVKVDTDQVTELTADNYWDYIGQIGSNGENATKENIGFGVIQ